MQLKPHYLEKALDILTKVKIIEVLKILVKNVLKSLRYGTQSDFRDVTATKSAILTVCLRFVLRTIAIIPAIIAN